MGDLKPSGVVEEPGAPRPIFGQDEDGDARETVAAWVTEADTAVARHVLAQAVGPNGRSGFKWFRFENGDLVLGVYPRGDTYFATEADPKRDDRAPVPLEELGLANLNPAEWPIHRLKDGYHACVNHDLALASTSFLTPEAMRRNADIIRVTPATVARMRQRYLEMVRS